MAITIEEKVAERISQAPPARVTVRYPKDCSEKNFKAINGITQLLEDLGFSVREAKATLEYIQYVMTDCATVRAFNLE